MKLISILTLSLLLPLAPAAFAAKGVGQVERIYPSGGKVFFRLKGDECKQSANAGNTYWYFELADATAGVNVSMLLAAANTSKTIKIGYPSCDPTKNQKINYLYQDF
ncbi:MULTISPECIES: hypothetical protein [Pseudoalteromonas]|uniref:Uncharacterized protein n=1 Tax=Pseudoalteromonas rubra TaxID=43658 RepID=A0A0L0EUU0_9GAMM|nr:MULTISPECIES: hypothetical protein [Pseudoalteromonas]ALU43557.1 hypothetical protein AT705_11720 [Pseudoalteromonas rubra]KNC68140.1 hypothetical protein AC626_06615 [Pseudoalteromonas rubra]MCG7563643.1 hypothetical protein [Pseudoalteromonas sp. McH1-42]MDK1313809.1 hypothetical protein [Pseudoalteromonas sp. R96]MEC4090259.1 hypothetical protein [Pseudoalteromonas rubra]